MNSVAIGKFFSDNLVGFFDIVGSTIFGPTLKTGGVTYVGGPETAEQVVGIGLGAGYGPALSLVLGKDFVISNKWTLGVAGHGLFGTMTEKAQPLRWTTAAGGVAFTFSFAPERWR